MKTSTFATDAGAELKNPENAVVDPSPVAETFEIVGVSPAVANDMNVDPSAQTSYVPVVLLNLMIPVAPVGLSPVVPIGNLNAPL